MVLIVLPDARQVDENVNSMLTQMRRWTNARQLKDLRRSKRARCQDHLSLGLEDRTVLQPDAGRTSAVKLDLVHPRLRPHRQICAALRFAKKRLCRTSAASPTGRRLIEPDAFLFSAIEVVIVR